MKKVCKFGGSSTANAEQFRKIAEIVREETSRQFIIVSAPGKDARHLEKVTDLLTKAWEARKVEKDWSEPWQAVRKRFSEIVSDLKLAIDLNEHFAEIEKQIRSKKATYDFVVSRGEYVCALMMADYLGFEFVDADQLIFFDREGKVHPVTYGKIPKRCNGSGGYVLPGFYGRQGEAVKAFPRNGSDITGAIVAGALKADLYENWSDTPLRVADPKIVPDAAIIRSITFREIRELAYLGASVLHADAIEPARVRGVPIRIVDINKPHDLGSTIRFEREPGTEVVAGIAGREGFVRFNLAMPGLHDQTGFAANVFCVFRDLGVSVEHFPTGTDTLSVVVHKDKLGDKTEAVLEGLQAITPSNPVEVSNGIALVTVVGVGMINYTRSLADIAGALADVGIKIRMISQDFRQTNVIVGVDESRWQDAIRAIYGKFMKFYQ